MGFQVISQHKTRISYLIHSKSDIHEQKEAQYAYFLKKKKGSLIYTQAIGQRHLSPTRGVVNLRSVNWPIVLRNPSIYSSQDLSTYFMHNKLFILIRMVFVHPFSTYPTWYIEPNHVEVASTHLCQPSTSTARHSVGAGA